MTLSCQKSFQVLHRRCRSALWVGGLAAVLFQLRPALKISTFFRSCATDGQTGSALILRFLLSLFLSSYLAFIRILTGAWGSGEQLTLPLRAHSIHAKRNSSQHHRATAKATCAVGCIFRKRTHATLWASGKGDWGLGQMFQMMWWQRWPSRYCW